MAPCHPAFPTLDSRTPSHSLSGSWGAGVFAGRHCPRSPQSQPCSAGTAYSGQHCPQPAKEGPPRLCLRRSIQGARREMLGRQQKRLNVLRSRLSRGRPASGWQELSSGLIRGLVRPPARGVCGPCCCGCLSPAQPVCRSYLLHAGNGRRPRLKCVCDPVASAAKNPNMLFDKCT